MPKFRDLQKQVWQTAEDKGFHKTPDFDRCGTLVRLCLIHTEISEVAQEVKRHGMSVAGIAEELADATIRLMDLAEGLGIDLESAIIKKNTKNQGREYLYGTPNATGA